MRRKPDPSSLAIGALLTVLVALGQISTSIYIPSLPSLVEAFDTVPGQVNLTLSVFLAGFAVAQLIYGPLSDRYGRRPVLLAGIALYFAASAACAFAGSIEALIAGRFAQALGACAGPVLGRAIIRDVYGSDRSARVMAYIGVAFAVSPALTPILGGYLQVWFGWQASFIFLALLAASVFGAVWAFLEETNPPNPEASRISSPGRTYAVFFSSPVFIGYAGAVAFVFAGMMAYTALAPFVFIEGFGLTPDAFGLLFVFIVLGFLAGTLTAGRLTLRLGVERMVLAGIVLALAGGGAMVALALAGLNGTAAVIAPMAVFLAGMGIVLPNGMAGAMAPFPKAAGAASALMGFTQMAVAAGASLIAGRLPHQTQLPMAILIFCLSLLALALFVPLVWRNRSRHFILEGRPDVE